MVVNGSLQTFTAYDKALEISSDDKTRSQIHSVHGMVEYKFGDIDGAKSSLFNRYFIPLNTGDFFFQSYTIVN
jgi:hypothetical protein